MATVAPAGPFSAELFTAEWVDELVALTADRPDAGGLEGIVGIAVGAKKKASEADAVFVVSNGRVTGSSTEAPEIMVPLAAKQVEAWMSGELVLAEAYMKGDLKPVGASGPLFAALEVLDGVIGHAG